MTTIKCVWTDSVLFMKTDDALRSVNSWVVCSALVSQTDNFLPFPCACLLTGWCPSNFLWYNADTALSHFRQNISPTHTHIHTTSSFHCQEVTWKRWAKISLERTSGRIFCPNKQKSLKIHIFWTKKIYFFSH